MRARPGDDAGPERVPDPRVVDFERVYREHARVVHGIALTIVGPADADDVAQDAFLAVQRGLSGLVDSSALSAWVCQVARNVARDHLRRCKRRPMGTSDVAELAAPSTGSETELARRVLELIRGLPEAYRETLVLRLAEGLSGPEIAARTGLTEGSLRVNLCRGMALLRPLLREEGWP